MVSNPGLDRHQQITLFLGTENWLYTLMVVFQLVQDAFSLGLFSIMNTICSSLGWRGKGSLLDRKVMVSRQCIFFSTLYFSLREFRFFFSFSVGYQCNASKVSRNYKVWDKLIGNKNQLHAVAWLFTYSDGKLRVAVTQPLVYYFAVWSI